MLRGVGGQADDESMFGTLFRAAARGEREEVRRILFDVGADVAAKDRHGGTALRCAAGNGHEVVVRMLLDVGADVEAMDRFGMTALDLAQQRGHEGVARVLRDAEAVRRQLDAQFQADLLYNAAGMFGDVEEVRQLIAGGADSSAKGSDGVTPLGGAAIHGHEEVTKVLLDAKADVTAKTSSGNTALDLAEAKGHAGVARILRDAGVAQAAERRTEKTLDLAKMQKEKGNAEYKKLSYATAAEAYSKAIRLTEIPKPPLPEEQLTATRALKLQCLVQIRRPSIFARRHRKSTLLNPPKRAQALGKA